MAEIDDIIQRLLHDRRMQESVTFSSRTYSDQPIIQTGRQLIEWLDRERTGKGGGDAAARRSDRDHRPPRKPRQERRQEQLSLGLQTTQPPAPPRPATSRPATRHVTERSAWPRHAQPPTTQATLPGSTPIPERYYRLRDIADSYGLVGRSSRDGSFAYGSLLANRVFYEQARLMEDFEDEYDFQGTYSQYFPTYSSMTLSQLRGYFTWRTHLRRGTVEEAPLSFAFLYVYELLCGIGTTPGAEGFAALRAFHEAFRTTDAAHGSTFDSYLRRWESDYVAYHGLDANLLPQQASGMQTHALTLLAAEDNTLAGHGMRRRGPALPSHDAPTDEQLLEALSECSRYQIRTARLCKDNLDDVAFVTRATFDQLVMHCAKRRKADFVEGLFGSAREEPYTMFSSAVFFDPEPHFDCEVAISPLEALSCAGGRWRHRVMCDVSGRSKELGTILHAVDQMLRERLDYPYPLKARPVPAYAAKIIARAIDQLMEQKAEQERRRITIDLSQLGRIRAAAAVTQEALLTEEERDEQQDEAASAKAAPTTKATTNAASHAEPIPASTPMPEAPAWQDVAPAATDGSLLQGAELRVMQALLEGKDPTSALEAGDAMLSLVVDAINEAFFDLVGDAVIEFDEDTPVLVEDYAEDIREALRS